MTRPPSYLPSPGRRGTVLVLVIWIILVLTVIAYSLTYEMRISMKMTAQGQKRLKAQGLARAGLAHAVMDLRNDRLLALADSGRNNDTLEDVWAQSKDKLDVKYGEGTYSVLILDEDRKLNINAIQPTAIGVLTYLLEKVGGIKRKEDCNIAASAIFDYRDMDLIPMTSKGSDEVEYYTEYARKSMRRAVAPDWSFRPRNDNFLTVSELLSIPGITGEVLYNTGKDEETDPFERAASRKKKDEYSLSDLLTANSIGQVNINTCPVVLLRAILVGTTSDRTAEKWADKIDKIRLAYLKKRTSDGLGLNNQQQLVQEGIPAAIVASVEKSVPLGTSSRIFTILARGECGGVRATIQAMVDVAIEPYSTDQLERRDRKRDPRAAALLGNQPNMVLDPAVRVISISEF